MRRGVILALVLALLQGTAAAQPMAMSSVHLSHANVFPGERETVNVVARDLQGGPLKGASVVVTVHYPSGVQRLHLRKTSKDGTSSYAFTVSRRLRAGNVGLKVDISNGYLRTSLNSMFRVVLRATAPILTATAAPRITHVIGVLARVLPPSVISPNPAWLLVYVHDRNGKNIVGAQVQAIATFKESTVRLEARTDTSGVATMKIDTSIASSTQKVPLAVYSALGTNVGTTSTEFSVHASLKPTPTAIPTSVPTSTTTAAPVAAPTPTATPTPIPSAPVAAGQISNPTPTDTVLPTAAARSSPSTSTPTSTPVLTSTPVPTSTPLPTSTAAPTSTATPVPNCPGSKDACAQAMLNIINQTRAQHQLDPFSLSTIQSNGTSSCAGSYGHSVAMAKSGSIWHSNSQYPEASFPNDICSRVNGAAENVGQCSTGNEVSDLNCVHGLMMREPYTPGCQGSHICNILSDKYVWIGIGVYNDGNATWVTEDFYS